MLATHLIKMYTDACAVPGDIVEMNKTAVPVAAADDDDAKVDEYVTACVRALIEVRQGIDFGTVKTKAEFQALVESCLSGMTPRCRVNNGLFNKVKNNLMALGSCFDVKQ